MGRGDRKTRKGKRSVSSYGKSRPHASRGAKKTVAVKKTATKTAASRPAAPARRPAAPAKKAPAKKTGA